MRRQLTKLSPMRLWILAGVAALCVVLQLADVRMRLGVFARGSGTEFYVLPFDRVRIDNLNTSNPGLRFAVLGFEFNKLYATYSCPWHARVSPFWTVFLPSVLLARFLPRLDARRTVGFEPVILRGGRAVVAAVLRR